MVIYLDISHPMPVNSDDEAGFSLNTNIWHTINGDKKGDITSGNYLTKGFLSHHFNPMMRHLTTEVNLILKKISAINSIYRAEIIPISVILMKIFIIALLFLKK